MSNIKLQDYSSNGMNCKVYVPDNVNADTEVFVFVHGGGEMTNENRYNDWNSVINNQLEKHGSNSIVVMPTMGDRWNENWATNTMDIVEGIQSDYGITNNNVTSCGFSFGGWGAARTTIENIQRNPDLEPQVLFMLDDYGHSTDVDANLFSDGGQDALLQNDTIIFSYVNPVAASTDQVTDKTSQMDALASSGVNLVRVVCDNGEHQAIKNNFFSNGMVDYTNGNINLPEDGYTYQRAVVSVDSTTGESIVTWEDIDVNDINTKDKLYNYFGIDSNGESSISSLSNLSGLSGGNKYVELEALQGWSNKIDTINEEMMDDLKTMLSIVATLKDSWNGNIAEGFVDDITSSIEHGQRTHNNMKLVPKLLIEVVNVENNL